MELTCGERIMILRTRAGLSKSKLGELISVSGETISSYEKGKSIPDYDTLQNLATVFGVTINMLMTGFDDVTKNQSMDGLI